MKRLGKQGNHMIDCHYKNEKDKNSERDEKECPDCGEEMELCSGIFVCLECEKDEQECRRHK